MSYEVFANEFIYRKLFGPAVDTSMINNLGCCYMLDSIQRLDERPRLLLLCCLSSCKYRVDEPPVRMLFIQPILLQVYAGCTISQLAICWQ